MMAPRTTKRDAVTPFTRRTPRPARCRDGTWPVPSGSTRHMVGTVHRQDQVSGLRRAVTGKHRTELGEFAYELRAKG
jgi:hypothetical protein